MKETNWSWTQFTITTIITLIVAGLAYWHDLETIKMTKVNLRPWLAVEPVKFDDKNSYISVNETKNGFNIKIRFKVTNTGQSVAKNIKSSDVFVTSQELFINDKTVCTYQGKANVIPTGTTSLTPNEWFFLEVGFEVPLIDKRAFVELQKKIENNTYELPFNIEIYYSGETDVLTGGKVALSLVLKSQGTTDYKYKINE